MRPRRWFCLIGTIGNLKAKLAEKRTYGGNNRRGLGGEILGMFADVIPWFEFFAIFLLFGFAIYVAARALLNPVDRGRRLAECAVCTAATVFTI